MNGWKRAVGLLAALLGAVGVIACLAGIVAVWHYNRQIRRFVRDSQQHVDVVLVNVEQRAEKTVNRFQNIRESMHTLDKRVQQRIAGLRGKPIERTANLDQLERRLAARFQQVQSWVEFMQSTAELVEQIASMMKSTQAFLQSDVQTVHELLPAIQAGRNELAEASKLFSELEICLADIRQNRNIKEHAKKFTSLSSRINHLLEKAQNHGTDFVSGLANVRVEIKELSVQSQKRLTTFAAVISVVLIWILISQLCLSVAGWKLVRVGRHPVEQ